MKDIYWENICKGVREEGAGITSGTDTCERRGKKEEWVSRASKCPYSQAIEEFPPAPRTPAQQGLPVRGVLHRAEVAWF